MDIVDQVVRKFWNESKREVDAINVIFDDIFSDVKDMSEETKK